MLQVLRSVNRTAYLAAFAAACVLFALPPRGRREWG